MDTKQCVLKTIVLKKDINFVMQVIFKHYRILTKISKYGAVMKK